MNQPLQRPAARRVWITVTLIATAWYYLLSGLFLVTADTDMTRRVDVLFNSDTAGWVGMMTEEHINDHRRTKHPLCRELWILPGQRLGAYSASSCRLARRWS